MTDAFVVFNPVAGHSDVGAVRRALEQHLTGGKWRYEVYQTTGDERVAEVVQAALGRGFDVCVAAGGDGTVSGVASGLARMKIPLGIIPVGTGNILARELGIPLDLEDALGLLTGEHAVADLDAIQVGDRLFFLNVSVGISALMMRDTEWGDKRRFGRIAYIWTGLTKLLGLQPHRFAIVVDGQTSRLRASEIVIANSGAMGDPSLRWGPQVHWNDGRLDVCIVRARTALDYLRVAWNVLRQRQARDPDVRFLGAERSVTVTASRPLPVQGDGEFIGRTPVQAGVVASAVQVVVPTATRHL